MADIEFHKNELSKKGWTLVRDFFTPDESDRFRELVIKETEKNATSGDVLSNEVLRPMLFTRKLSNLLTDLLGDTPIYFGDSVALVHKDGTKIQNGFHRDVLDVDNSRIDWSTPYSVLRVGIYLQDHKEHSEGLIVRETSNTGPEIEGKKIIVPSSATDLIIWSLTTLHSGDAKRFKWFPDLVVTGERSSGWLWRLYYHAPAFLFRPREKRRVSVFGSFARRDHHLVHYNKYLLTRGYFDKKKSATIRDQKQLDHLRENGFSYQNYELEFVF